MFSSQQVLTSHGSADDIPIVATLTGYTSTPVNSNSLNVSVIFNKAVAGLTAAAFAVSNPGGGLTSLPAAGDLVLLGSGASYNLLITGMSGSGVLLLTLSKTLSAAADLFGNALTSDLTLPIHYGAIQSFAIVLFMRCSGQTTFLR